MGDSLVDLTQERADHGDASIEVGLEFSLQIEHRDLPALGFDGRVGQGQRSFRLSRLLCDGLVGRRHLNTLALASGDPATHEHPSEHDESGNHRHLLGWDDAGDDHGLGSQVSTNGAVDLELCHMLAMLVRDTTSHWSLAPFMLGLCAECSGCNDSSNSLPDLSPL